MTAALFENSRWAIGAALALAVLGLPIGGFGLLLIGQGLVYEDTGGMGYGTLAMVIGALVVAIGLLHVVSAFYALRHRSWARNLGIVIAVLGAMLGAFVLPSAFNPRYVSRPPDYQTIAVGPDPTSILIGLSVFPYALVIVGLLLGGAHFRKRPASSPG